MDKEEMFDEVLDREKVRRIVLKIVEESMGRMLGPLIITLLIAGVVIYSKTLLVAATSVFVLLMFVIVAFFAFGHSLRQS
jgi:amino acid permease